LVRTWYGEGVFCPEIRLSRPEIGLHSM